MASKDFYKGRRKFLTRSAGLLTASLLAPYGWATGSKDKIQRSIPSSGELLPVIGMGTSRTFDVDPVSAQSQALAAVLQRFFDLGGAVIDTSPMYGNAERVLGELLKQTGNKQALFSATKVWTDGHQNGLDQMERSRQLVGVGKFDLIQVHNLRDWQIHLRTLKEWKAQGRVRYIGITTSHGRFHEELATIMEKEPLDFVQFSYNINYLEAEKRLLPLARERGIATLINRPFQRGELFSAVKGKPLPEWASEIDCQSWGQFFLKFIAGEPAVTCIIPATSKIHHMQDNMAAGYGRLPDERLRKMMRDYFVSL